MKLTDWACEDCLKRHTKLVKFNKLESQRKQQRKERSKRKEMKKFYEAERKKGL